MQDLTTFQDRTLNFFFLIHFLGPFQVLPEFLPRQAMGSQAARCPLPGCRSFAFRLLIPLKVLVFDLIPSSGGSAGWGGTRSFSGQNVFLQMKELAFIIIIVIIVIVVIILMGTEGTEATFLSFTVLSSGYTCVLRPPLSASFATGAGTSPGTWKWGSWWQWLSLAVLDCGLRFTPPRTVASIL